MHPTPEQWLVALRAVREVFVVLRWGGQVDSQRSQLTVCELVFELVLELRATRDADVASTLLRECQENDIQPTDAMVADVIAICSACGQWEAAKVGPRINPAVAVGLRGQ